ncbi:exonuclease [Tsukamurella phage TPA2]|uniref:exonuclease n=1 Tax=Tsukamurella phage TPA2 TaxID=981330 RepID=UPI0001FF8DD0|nr:exonuclease [Tsukamurella phage TPA2]ADX31971.1 hypothetical protein [Tsukamurella phage TPA2]
MSRQPTAAEMFPAREQPDGRTWYRAKNGPMGWTANPEFADPSYFTETPTTEETPDMELTETGELPGRTTEHSHYPLPPAAPRPGVKYVRGRYSLPDPKTGAATGFTRVTNIAKVLEDTFQLSRWSRRETVKRVISTMEFDRVAQERLHPQMEQAVGQLGLVRQLIDESQDSKLNYALDDLDNLLGGKDAAEFGTAVHEWCGAVDLGMCTVGQVPEQFRPHVQAYQALLARHGLIAEPAHIERTVLNYSSDLKPTVKGRKYPVIAGTYDRVFRCSTTGRLYMGDLKTSKTSSLPYAWIGFGVQMDFYRTADYLFSLDGQSWETMPELVPDFGILIHLPSDDVEKSAAITFDMATSTRLRQMSLDTYVERSNASKSIPSVHALPIPSPEGSRRALARLAITNISDPDDLAGIWEEYQDVWTPDLTDFGQTVAGALQ